MIGGNVSIPGFHSCYNTAMFEINTIQLFLLKIICIKVKFVSLWTSRQVIDLSSQHSHHDITCKPELK